MTKENEEELARRNARLYGWPGRTKNSPNAKTGKFTGYWKSGRAAWTGRFEVGEQVGLWEYHLVASTPGVVHEFYCNL
jgi:hypothetical protein